MGKGPNSKRKKIIGPSQNLIGGDFNPVEEATTKIELDDRAPVDYEANRKYNAEINKHPELIDRLVIRDNYILVRLFKYDRESISEGGIILEDTEVYSTDGGQIRARIKDTPYQRRGVIVKVGHQNSSDHWKKYLVPEAIIHLPENKLKEHHVDKTKKTDIGHGYFMINAATVEAIELPNVFNN
jgi:hypothetical protein